MLKEISGASRWNFRACLCVVAVSALGACGGGSDPLDVGGGSSENVDLRAAYERVTCGMTIEQARNAVGVEENTAGSSWIWYAVGVNSDQGELDIDTGIGSNWGFPEDGIRRATAVYYTHGKNGVYLPKQLCR